MLGAAVCSRAVGVDNVAGDHRLALARPGIQSHERLSRAHGNPDPEPVTLLPRPVTDRERCTHRPLGIILARHRRSQHGHHRIADELLDRPTEPFQLTPHVTVVRPEQCPHVLRIEHFCPSSEPDEIDEDNTHDLSLLARGRLRARLRSTVGAKEKVARDLPIAAGTGLHKPSLRRLVMCGQSEVSAARSWWYARAALRGPPTRYTRLT